jgi:hypothetical protein
MPSSTAIFMVGLHRIIYIAAELVIAVISKILLHACKKIRCPS